MDKKLNILQIFASSAWGGGELYVYDLTSSLIKDGYKVTCISKSSESISKKMKEIDSKYFVINFNGIADIISAIKIKKILLQENINIIHVHNFKTAFIALYAKILSKQKIKIILSRHLVKKAKTGFLYKFLYSRIDKIIFVSQLAKNEFLKTQPKIDKSELLVIHNSVKKAELRKAVNIREELNIDKSSTILCYTGRLVPEKGIEILLSAISLLKDKDIFLIILGKGEKEYEKKLREIAIENGITEIISFYGFSENVQGIISQIDIGICPSIWREPFGLSIIEFIEKGKVVITTNNGAQKEYIESGKNGILVDVNDANAIKENVIKLIENPNYKKEIEENAKEYFDSHLSYNVFYRKIIEVYNE